jgi:hypothetical protein
MTEIARGDINVSLNDKDALAGLDRLDAEFRAKMAAIDRTEAHAKIDADVRKFDDAIDRTKAKLLALKNERAEVVVQANKDDLDRKIASAEMALRRLNGRKAEVKVEVQGVEKALAAEAAISKAEADRARAYEQYSRRRQQLDRQQETTQRAAETAAARADVAAAKQAQRVAQLRREYGKLTDDIEKQAGQKTPFGKEAKIKVGLDEEYLRARLEAVKAELNALGGHPPVQIKVDTDEGFLQRTKLKLLGFANDVRSGLDNIGDVRLNAGPISGTVRTIGAAVAALAPIITSLGGGITSLVGVVGTSLAGALSIGGGLLAGMALNFGGVVAAIKPAIANFMSARAATQAYSTAVQKYGADSKQAKKAQEEMNSTLKSVDPNARNAAIGVHLMSTEWQKLTGNTAKMDFGRVLAAGVKTASVLLPTLAHNTDDTLNILRSHFDSVFEHLRQPQGSNILGSLGKSANDFLGPALSGAEKLGAVFAHVGESAARIFGGATGKGFENFASSLDKATQPGAKLDAEITRLGTHAGDVLHLFASLGRLIATVLNGSANSGDSLVRTMSAATERWRQFLDSTKGQTDMEQFFKRSVIDVEALAGALMPLIAAFVQWSDLLAPFTSGLLQGITFVSRLIAGFTKLVGLAGPFSALGATFGVIFAVGKIGAFVGMLGRVLSLARELGALGSLKALFTGGFNGITGLLGGARGAGATIAASMTEAGAAVAAEIRAAMLGGGTEAAAEVGTAEAAGGAAGGAASAAEGAAGAGILSRAGGALKGILGIGGGAAAAGEIEATTAATAGLEGAVGGLGLALSPETLGISALVGGLAVLAIHFMGTGSAAKTYQSQIRDVTTANTELKNKWGAFQEALTGTESGLHRSNLNLAELKKQLDSTKDGTREHAAAELSYNEALRENLKLRAESTKRVNEGSKANKQNLQEVTEGIEQSEKLSKVQKEKLEQDRHSRSGVGKVGEDSKQLQETEARRVYLAQQLNESLNRQAAYTDEIQRAYKGLPELTAQAAQSIGQLARTAGGKPIAIKIATKFTSSNDVGSVSSAASSALGAGIKQSVVLKIVADSSSAKQALSSLAQIQVAAKIVHISADDGPKVVAMLQHIAGIKLEPKQARIISAGGPAAVAMLDHILGIKIPTKHTNIIAHDGVTAIARAAVNAILGVPTSHTSNVKANVFGLPEVSTLSSVIAGLTSKTISVAVNTINTTTDVVKHLFGHATGGPHGPFEKTRGGEYNKPTLLVGEENRTEYVIATNPAYRQDNAQYLQEAAKELGFEVTAASKGKSKTKAKKTKGSKASDAEPGLNATTKQITALHVPDPYSAAAVPMEKVDEIVSKIDSALSSEKKRAVSLKNSRDSAAKSVAHAREAEHGKKAGSKALADAKRTTKHAEEKLHDYERGINVIEHSGGNWHHVNFKSIPQLEADSHQAHSDKGRLESANHEIEHLNSVISTDQTRLQNIATQYNRSGDESLKQGPNGWNAILGDRRSAIDRLGGILGRARSTAQAIQGRYPSSALGTLIDSLAAQEAAVESANVETTNMESEGPEGPKGEKEEGPALGTKENQYSAEQYVAAIGMKETLQNLNEAYAIAQTNNVTDNPNTPQNEELPTLADDLTSASNLQSFWEQVLSKARETGQYPETITDIANDLTSARSTYSGLLQQTEQDASLASSNAYNDMINFSDARSELYKNFGSNFAPIWTQTPPSAPSSSFIGGAGQNAVGSQPAGNVVNMNVENHFSHPPADPHSWSNGVAWELQAAI